MILERMGRNRFDRACVEKRRSNETWAECEPAGRAGAETERH